MMRKAPVNLYIVTNVSASKYVGNLRFVVNMLQLNGAIFWAVTIIRVCHYFGNLRFVVSMLQLSGANCRADIIIRVSKYFGKLRFSVMYTNLRVRTADIIGADVFQGIRVSFQST